MIIMTSSIFLVPRILLSQVVPYANIHICRFRHIVLADLTPFENDYVGVLAQLKKMDISMTESSR
jgi:hypothetical protein